LNIILSHGYFLNEDEKEKEILKPYVPLGILYLSAWLEEKGIGNKVVDNTFSSLDIFKEQLVAEQPGILAMYINLVTKLNVLKIIDFVRNEPALANTTIILGGPESRHHSADFLLYGADYVITGEGEETMHELVTAIISGSSTKGIAGTSHITAGGTICHEAERPLIKDINQLPFPNRYKIDFTPYLQTWKQKHGYSMMSVSTMRGCPYSCKWCSRAVYGGTYRRRSPQLVAAELKMLKAEYNPDMIWFVDDVFTIHHGWLKAFAAEVKKADAMIPYEIISRADRLNEEVIQVLKESGCFRVWIGAESGSQKIIDAMDRRVDVVATREMIQMAKRYGIEAGTFIMLGYPGETKQDIRRTIHHLIAANPSQYTITVTYPIKGTRLYNEVSDQFLTSYEFAHNTDRDIDFKRLHPKRYYEHARQWLHYEVYAGTQNPPLLKKGWLKLKSLKSQVQMWMNR
jgi:anaerobic magnesium-protoporphyrin IX monomethyl ester cyclase